MKTTALLFLILTAAAWAGDEEAIAFGINDFNHTSASNLWYSRGFAEKFNDAFQSKRSDGQWDIAIEKFDDATDGEDFTDASKNNVGADAVNGLGIDHADVGFISTHGSAWWDGSYVRSSLTMGEVWNDGNENRSYVVSDTDMQLGDDLEIFIAAACKSAQLSFLTSGGMYKAMKPGNTLQFWLGFHGISYDSLTDRNRVRDFAKHSFWDGLGANWVEDLTRGRGLSADQCATAVIRGTSVEMITTNFEYAGFRDRGKDYSATWNHRLIWYIDGCAPKGGPKL